MRNHLICLALVLCTLHSACGLYFHILETERKCFIEEVPDETTVIVNYKVELYDPRSNGFMPSSPGIGMHVEVRDSDDKVILSRVYSSQGRMSFTSHTPGEHVICMYSNSTAWFNGAQLRVHLDIQVGERAIDYANVAQKEELTNMELRIRQLLGQVEQITKEQNYDRYREERFTHICQNTNSLMCWWSLGQSLLLAFLVCNGMRATRHWKLEKQQFVGTLTITDFFKILQMYYKSLNSAMDELEDQKLDPKCRELHNQVMPMVSIGPDTSLFDAIKLLRDSSIHRLPVINPENGNVLYILTEKSILRLMLLYINAISQPAYMKNSLRDLKIGTSDNNEIPDEKTCIKIESFGLLDIFAKFDVISPATAKICDDLDVSLRKANEHCNEWFDGDQKCNLDESLYTIMERIVCAEVHRLVVVDDQCKVIGVISISDILLYLVLRPSGEGFGGLENSLRVSDPMMLRNRAKVVSAKTTPLRSPSAVNSGNQCMIEDISEEEAAGALALAVDNNKSASEVQPNQILAHSAQNGAGY
ncbi:5'-AMP-activated protein kinase subunit gamma-1-like [Drosophila montana]|uniref:5'-AMP-activated protein kinase subunit gamma-1-like n=1 Tax=Drosophila montana TaxID=40370 RepID=UPI00313CED57